mmetsp:Transcript_40389/g.59343  ORF Transcript_40389/g.59343 Transcript_40389/m.59343 type:complete len:210 (-) Transcript_40389:242-871(-)
MCLKLNDLRGKKRCKSTPPTTNTTATTMTTTVHVTAELSTSPLLSPLLSPSPNGIAASCVLCAAAMEVEVVVVVVAVDTVSVLLVQLHPEQSQPNTSSRCTQSKSELPSSSSLSSNASQLSVSQQLSGHCEVVVSCTKLAEGDTLRDVAGNSGDRVVVGHWANSAQFVVSTFPSVALHCSPPLEATTATAKVLLWTPVPHVAEQELQSE